MTNVQIPVTSPETTPAADRWIPLTGLGAVLCVIGSLLLAGSPPDVGSPVADIVEHYTDNAGPIYAGSLASVAAAVLLVSYAAHLRSVLRADGGDDRLPIVALIGATLIAVGAAIDSTISIALAEAADRVDPAAVQALQALWDRDYVPFQLGTQLFLIAVGIEIVRRATLPRWLGWVALGLAVAGFTPIGYVAFAGLALWIVVTSVLLAVRGTPVGR